MLESVVHQNEAIQVLRRIISGQIDNPVLLLGPSGVGKSYAVSAFVRDLFCVGDKTPDCSCHHCVSLRAHQHPDFNHVTHPAGKNIPVAAIRAVVESAAVYPTLAPKKVVFIEGVDYMTPSAGDSLLKVLEEPPETMFLLLSAENPDHVLSTIRSRCLIVPFHNIPAQEIARTIVRLGVDEKKAPIYANLAGGSLGRALELSMGQQLALRDVAINMLHALGDVVQVFSLVEEHAEQLPKILPFMTTILHDLFLREYPEKMLNQDITERIQNLPERLSGAFLRSLWASYHEMLKTHSRLHTNLPLQVKTWLVSHGG